MQSVKKQVFSDKGDKSYLYWFISLGNPEVHQPLSIVKPHAQCLKETLSIFGSVFPHLLIQPQENSFHIVYMATSSLLFIFHHIYGNNYQLKKKSSFFPRSSSGSSMTVLIASSWVIYLTLTQLIWMVSTKDQLLYLKT